MYCVSFLTLQFLSYIDLSVVMFLSFLMNIYPILYRKIVSCFDFVIFNDVEELAERLEDAINICIRRLLRLHVEGFKSLDEFRR